VVERGSGITHHEGRCHDSAESAEQASEELMECERERAIRNWWSRIDDDERDELMWANAGIELSLDQVTRMEEAGIVLAGRQKAGEIDLRFTMPADVAQIISECT
jgi:hypothetical protein